MNYPLVHSRQQTLAAHCGISRLANPCASASDSACTHTHAARVLQRGSEVRGLVALVVRPGSDAPTLGSCWVHPSGPQDDIGCDTVLEFALVQGARRSPGLGQAHRPPTSGARGRLAQPAAAARGPVFGRRDVINATPQLGTASRRGRLRCFMAQRGQTEPPIATLGVPAARHVYSGVATASEAGCAAQRMAHAAAWIERSGVLVGVSARPLASGQSARTLGMYQPAPGPLASPRVVLLVPGDDLGFVARKPTNEAFPKYVLQRCFRGRRE